MDGAFAERRDSRTEAASSASGAGPRVELGSAKAVLWATLADVSTSDADLWGSIRMPWRRRGLQGCLVPESTRPSLTAPKCDLEPLVLWWANLLSHSSTFIAFKEYS